MRFVDAHTHLELFAFMGVPFHEMRSLEELRDFLSNCEDDVVLGWGWDEDTFGKALTKEDLKEVGKPVLLIRIDGHVGVANDLFLERFSPKGKVDHEKGYLYEDTLWNTVGDLKPRGERMRKILKRAVEEARSKGIVEVHDFVDVEVARIFMEMDEETLIRIVLMPYYEHYTEVLDLFERVNPKNVALGWVKVYVDGSIGARTAFLKEPYRDKPGWRGVLLKSRKELESIVKELEERGLRVAFHAIGDGAIEECLQALESARLEYHRIEHAELITEDQALRAKGLKVLLCMQPNFKPFFLRTYLEALGEERTKRIDPIDTLDRLGVDMIFGSDMMPFDPMYGFNYAKDILGEEKALYYYGGWRYEGRYI